MSESSEFRSEYISGLRRLANLLEQNEWIPIPQEGKFDFHPISLGACLEDQSLQVIRKIRRKIGGPFTKRFSGSNDQFLFLEGKIDGLFVQIYTLRDEVCTRRVVGSEEVTETIRDPQAPMVTVTRTREIVEWDCKPLLEDES